MDIELIRDDFPAIKIKTNENPIIYFDNTSTTLTPKPVLDSIMEYYSTAGNLRSAHESSIKTMMDCDEARKKVCNLINSRSSNEIIWTKNTTEAINLVAKTIDFQSGDIILSTDKEHNSNMSPWQTLSKFEIQHKIIESKRDLSFDLETFDKELSNDVKLVSMGFTSIIDGYTIPAQEIIKLSHENGALVLLDAGQTAPHQQIDVQALDVDFLAFSFGNMCGPTGVGVLFGKGQHLENLNPFLSGSGANSRTTFEESEFQPPPAKFEAGALNSAGIIGAGSAVDYLNSIGFENISKHEYQLNKYITEELVEYKNLKLLGPEDPKQRGGLFNFNIEGINPHDIGITLEEIGNILLRTGRLCASAWFRGLLKDGAVSVSFYIYNTLEEVEILVDSLKNLLKSFA